jgi:hypothetical protein
MCIAPSRPPLGTRAGPWNMQGGLAGPPATSAGVQLAAAQGGAAGSTTYTASAANDRAMNRRTNAAHSVRLRSQSTPATA